MSGTQYVNECVEIADTMDCVVDTSGHGNYFYVEYNEGSSREKEHVEDFFPTDSVKGNRWERINETEVPESIELDPSGNYQFYYVQPKYTP